MYNSSHIKYVLNEKTSNLYCSKWIVEDRKGKSNECGATGGVPPNLTYTSRAEEQTSRELRLRSE